MIRKFPNITVPIFTIIVTLTFLLSIAGFIIATLLLQNDRDTKLQTAQRELNGNQAMIFAVCRAFYHRDQRQLYKWQSVTDLELKFQVKANSPDAAYHIARLKALLKFQKEDAKRIEKFDCFKSMERAYVEGFRDATTATGKPDSIILSKKTLRMSVPLPSDTKAKQ